MKKWFRKIHRWLGVLMALQILAWMASGLYFALFPIETIRGEHLAAALQVTPHMLLQGLHHGRRLHFGHKIARVVAAAAEVATLGDLDALRGDRDPVLRQGSIEIHPPLGIEADVMPLLSRPAQAAAQEIDLAHGIVPAVPGRLQRIVHLVNLHGDSVCTAPDSGDKDYP